MSEATPSQKKMFSEVTTELPSKDVGRPFAKKPFKCPYCRKSFETARSLRQHITTKHKKQFLGLFTCETCNKSYDHKKHLKNHLDQHPGCQKKLIISRAAADPQNPVRDIRRRSSRKKASTKEEKKSAKIKAEPTSFNCQHCTRTFSDHRALKIHMQIHSQLVRRFSCEVCGNKYVNKDGLNQHKKKSPRCQQEEQSTSAKISKLSMETATDNGETDSTEPLTLTDRSGPVQTSERSNQSDHATLPLTTQEFPTDYVLQDAVTRNEALPSTSSLPSASHQSVVSNDCKSLTARGTSNSSKSIEITPNECSNGPSTHPALNPNSYKCSLCPKVITGKGNLKSHMKTHNLRSCQGCGQFFQNQMELRKHRYKSRDCQNLSASSSRHTKTSELAGAPLAAGLSACNLTNLIVIKPMSPGSASASNGSVNASTSVVASTIMPVENTPVSQAPIEERNRTLRFFRCPECLGWFDTRLHLECHLKMHENPKKFSCDLCEKKYCRKGDLVYHKKTKHGGEVPSHKQNDDTETLLDVDMVDLTEAPNSATVPEVLIVKENNQSEQVSSVPTTTESLTSGNSQQSIDLTQSLTNLRVYNPCNFASVAQNASNECINGGILGSVSARQLDQSPVNQLIQLPPHENFAVTGSPFIQYPSMHPLQILGMYNPYNVTSLAQITISNFINNGFQGTSWGVHPYPNNSMILQNDGMSNPTPHRSSNESSGSTKAEDKGLGKFSIDNLLKQ